MLGFDFVRSSVLEIVMDESTSDKKIATLKMMGITMISNISIIDT